MVIEWILFKTFFKVTALTVGGGYAMIPVIEDELVNHKKLISEELFFQLIGKVQVLPGIIAINSALIVGYEIAKVKGAIASVLGTVIPPFCIILGVALFFRNFQDNTVVLSFFNGARIATAVILVDLALKLIKKRRLPSYLLVLIVLLFLSFFVLDVFAVYILLISFSVFYLAQVLVSFLQKDKSL